MKYFFAALIFLAPLTASAGGKEYMTYGAGASTCGLWVEARKGDNYHIFSQWMLGYISGTDH